MSHCEHELIDLIFFQTIIKPIKCALDPNLGEITASVLGTDEAVIETLRSTDPAATVSLSTPITPSNRSIYAESEDAGRSYTPGPVHVSLSGIISSDLCICVSMYLCIYVSVYLSLSLLLQRTIEP